MIGGLIPFQESMQTELGISDSNSFRPDPTVLMPISGYVEMSPDASISGELLRFAEQLGALPTSIENMPPVNKKRHTLIV
jgi:hypothetical protein